MILKTLDGREIKKDLKPSEYRVKNEAECKSKAQYKMGQILLQLYPNFYVLEEVPAKIDYYTTLYLDFFVPQKRIVFECHGAQHYKFVKFYHQDKKGWDKARNNDAKKMQWCNYNNIEYISIPDNKIDIKYIKKELQNLF